MQRPPFQNVVQFAVQTKPYDPNVVQSALQPSAREQQIREATERGWPIQETR